MSVPPGSTETVVFRSAKSTPGAYKVLLGSEEGQFTVQAPPKTSNFGGGLGTGGIIAIVVIAIVFIVAMVLLFARTRRE